VKNKDSISLTLTTNGGFVLYVPTGSYCGTYSHTTTESLFEMLISVLNEHPSIRKIIEFSLTYKGEDDAM